jgi:hypothetical protein
MGINNIFATINIINDLKTIILKYITESHKNILDMDNCDFKIEQIISKDNKLMNYILKELDLDEKKNIFSLCAKFGKLENMKLLHKKKFPKSKNTFDRASKYANLTNIK